ncbi:MAG: hypothetical protein ABI639_16070 [Thermoanaerobaculia bacterium]
MRPQRISSTSVGIATIAGLWFCFALGTDSRAFASEVYTATAEFESARTLGTNRVPFRLVIDSTTPVEEVPALRDLLLQGGQDLLRSSMRTRANGRIQLGGFEFGVSLVLVTPLEGGARHVLVVAERPFRRTVEGEPADAQFPFGILAFDVDSRGSGEGSILPAAALSVDDKGKVQTTNQTGDPGRLLDVQLQD